MNRPDVEHPWLFDRICEVEAKPNGHLDLWAREHYKSTIITFAKTIQDILASHGDDPLPEWNGRELTVGIFSHNRSIAKGFLRQIKHELTENALLKEWFPDVLYADPDRESPKWSENDGLIIKRKTNPKEATVEAWGLVDGMPTGKHYLLRLYDDVVTEKSVATVESMEKTTKAWELSDNLGTDGGVERYVGTRYHFNDTYGTMMKRDVVTVRQYPCRLNGDEDGEPVLMSDELLRKKRRKQGPYTFGCQMMQNPKGDDTQNFQEPWLRYYENAEAKHMNVYIVVDPAGEKKKSSDYTYMEVIGLGPDQNYYTLDMIRDRMNLTERTRRLFELHRKWRPLGVGYEKYGLQADIEHIETVMEQETYRFKITPLGGPMPKTDRIKRLIPIFEQGRWYMPRTLYRTDFQGVTVDLVQAFIEEEYKAFPVSSHDDMLDGRARILEADLGAKFPMEKTTPKRKRRANGGGSWMGG